MSTQYGATPAGFVIKPLAQIVTDMGTGCQNNIDPAIDTSPDMPLGQLLGVVGNALSQLWELGQVNYNQSNRNAAEGNQLDNIGTLTGTLRPPAKQSSVFCTCVFSASGTYSAGSLVGFVTGQPSVTFYNALDIVLSAPGTVTGCLFASSVDGAVLAPAGTLVNISTPVSGWTSIANPADATPGTVVADDPSYRLLQEEELSAAGSTTGDAIRADLLQVPGVQQAQVYENHTMVTDANGVPPKSFECVIFDGIVPQALDANVGQVVWDDKPSGIQMFGQTQVTVTDSQQNAQVALFTRPAQLLLYANYTLTIKSGANITLIAPLVKAAMVAYLNANGGPGIEVVALALRAQALTVPGVIDCTLFQLDTVSSPTNVNNLFPTTRQIIVGDTGRILVNGI